MTTVSRSGPAVGVAPKSNEPPKPQQSSPPSKWTAPADSPNDSFVPAPGATKHRTIANPRQTVKLESVTVPHYDFAANKGSALEVSVPLKSLEVAPLSMDVFVNDLKNAKVTMSPTWAVADQGEQPKLSFVDGSIRMSFENISVNALARLPPQMHVKMPGGQLILLELRPQTVKLDTRAHELAHKDSLVASSEAFIARNEFPAATEAMKASLEQEKAQVEEVRSRPFVGYSELTAYAER
ncbi:MAG: hypothetical protein DI536_13210 [Archangium gephyra]|uniref:Uncharacterized protein n=1 Tax=Archangium gephyra TaxID=48 RepID=A0A2W5TCP9_9BACT|nr:MAG: hypothetical protein DI536_13210 [Archangium gephyra]